MKSTHYFFADLLQIEDYIPPALLLALLHLLEKRKCRLGVKGI
jgi:hypothetical protein